ncbi:unnamed protein product [Coccothraustes coccothraustes]
MADRFLSLFKVFRGKNKKGPGAAPAQQPEDPEEFQTLQDNAALDKTQEQEPGRRRFRKTLQPFRKFLRIRRRKTGTTAAEGPAEPDSGLTELQAEPDVSPDSAEPSQDSMNEDRAKADMAPTEDADMAVTEDMTITNANTAETQGISNTDTTPTPTLKEQVIAPYFKDPCAPSQPQPEDPEQFQTLQDNAALDKTQEQEPGRRRFRKTLQPFRKFLRIRRRKTGTTAAEGPAEPDSGLTELQAEPDVSPDSAEPSQDSMNEDRAKADMAPTEDADMAVTEDMTITNANTAETQGISNTDTTPTPTLKEQVIAPYFKDPCAPSQPQVPAIVRRIHQRLLSKVTVDARLQIDIVRLAEERPDDLVLTLLRCAPTCDRAAAMMWRTIGSSGPAVEKVLPTLLIVMASWPLHSICTSDGDDRDIFALTATLVIWVIVQVPECHEAMILYSSRLFVTLLFHIAITTQQMPPLEASNFWKACQEEHRLPSKPNRFAVQAMKALLCRLRCDHVVVAMERKRGWDTLLCAHTQHYAVGLLAREMRRNLIPLCSRIALHLLRQLNRQDPYWDLPFLAFLVEVLEFLDLRECGGSVVKIMARYLHSKCRERHRLALRGLVVLSKDLSMVQFHSTVHFQILLSTPEPLDFGRANLRML